MNTFKVGDVVRLKSGGPDMTVGMVCDNNYIEVAWFAGAEAKLLKIKSDALQLSVDVAERESRRKALDAMARVIYCSCKTSMCLCD